MRFHATKVAINLIRAKDFARKKHGRHGKMRKEAEKHGKSLPKGVGKAI